MDEKNPTQENIIEEATPLEKEETIVEESHTDFIKDENPTLENIVMPDPKDYGWHPAMPNFPQNNVNNNYQYPPFPYYPYAPVPNPPKKKKMKAGTKAFFVIVSSLLTVLLITTTTYAAYKIIKYVPENNYFENYFNQFLPDNDFSEKFDDYFGNKDNPSKDKNDLLPDTSDSNVDEIVRPDITPNTNGIKLNSTPKTAEKSAKDIYASIKNSIVGVVIKSNGEIASQGSGIIATEDGYIITNAHVILNKRTVDVTIVMNDETEHKAAVVGFDKTTDLAVLKIYDTNNKFVPAQFGNSDELAVGEWVLAIGNPGGQDFASSLTRGIVSAVNRKVGSNSKDGMTYIQTDAAINPGNSGGALVNMHGQVIGINSSKIVASGYEGMGFSIPITQAKSIIDELMATGYVEGRTRLGISGYDITSAQIAMYKVPQGFLIAAIDKDGAFAGTDAMVGDIITEMDGETVTGISDITAILAKHKAGDYVKVKLYRYDDDNSAASKTFEIEICLLEDKGETQG